LTASVIGTVMIRLPVWWVESAGEGTGK